MITIIRNLFDSKIFLFVILFLFMVPVSGKTQSDDLNAHPAVWLIEKDNSKTYFLGSVHLLPPDIKWYGGVVEQVFESADEIVFEVNMTPEKQKRAQQISQASALLPEGATIDQYLTDDEMHDMNENALSLGIPPQAISRMQPWIISISLSISAIKKEGWDSDSGVDKYIQELANAKNIKISELETIETQMASLTDHPIDIQAEMLKDTLEQLKDMRNLTMKMVGSWASGDMDQMETAFLEPMKEQKEVYKKLVIDRNKNWIPIIENLINKNQTTFIVAGAAHFIGEDGVIELLRQSGYILKKIQ
jgi:uncharacterized protein